MGEGFLGLFRRSNRSNSNSCSGSNCSENWDLPSSQLYGPGRPGVRDAGPRSDDRQIAAANSPTPADQNNTLPTIPPDGSVNKPNDEAWNNKYQDNVNKAFLDSKRVTADNKHMLTAAAGLLFSGSRAVIEQVAQIPDVASADKDLKNSKVYDHTNLDAARQRAIKDAVPLVYVFGSKATQGTQQFFDEGMKQAKDACTASGKQAVFAYVDIDAARNDPTLTKLLTDQIGDITKAGVVHSRMVSLKAGADGKPDPNQENVICTTYGFGSNTINTLKDQYQHGLRAMGTKVEQPAVKVEPTPVPITPKIEPIRPRPYVPTDREPVASTKVDILKQLEDRYPGQIFPGDRLREARAQALREHVPLVINFSGVNPDGKEWCGPCRVFKENKMAAVEAQYAQNNRAVFVNMHVSEQEFQAIAKQFGFKSVPAVIVEKVGRDGKPHKEVLQGNDYYNIERVLQRELTPPSQPIPKPLPFRPPVEPRRKRSVELDKPSSISGSQKAYVFNNESIQLNFDEEDIYYT